MKKSKVLSTPTRISDLDFDDFDADDAVSLKADRLNTRKWRLKNEAAA